ncbi:MAG: hypothetical protein V4608_03285 [Bacteroidota bacterium]
MESNKETIALECNKFDCKHSNDARVTVIPVKDYLKNGCNCSKCGLELDPYCPGDALWYINKLISKLKGTE